MGAAGRTIEGDAWERLPGVLQWIAELGAEPEDDEERALRRRVLNLATALMVVLSPIWVGTYLALGHELSAAIPLAWMVAAVTLLSAHARLGIYGAFRFCALSMMLVFPFLLMWSLGGFANSSVVGLWALIAPLGATLFAGTESSMRWFGGLVLLIAVSVVLDPALAESVPEIPEAVRVAFFGLNLTAVSLTALLILHYFVRARELEQARSERLLLNVLPRPIAARLKRSDAVIADACPDATVLFADLVGFTPLTESIAPDQVVQLLDRIFTAWDALAAELRLEKIKTIGDEYMVVGGVPEPRSDHAAAVAWMALQMREELRSATQDLQRPLDVRIGIDCGPVIAGVIGRVKFSYDLWGQTVNTASRMESEGMTGRIQITERMRERLGASFTTTRRQAIEVKGLGRMTTWFLEAGDRQ